MYFTEMLCYKQQIEFYSSSSYHVVEWSGFEEENKQPSNFLRRAFKANKKVSEKLFFCWSSAKKKFSFQ